MSEEEKQSRGIWDIDRSARIELAKSLLARTPKPDRWEAGEEAFRRIHPNAPEAMISSAVHHVYGDGVDAALDWLADAELFLRGESTGLDLGKTYHLVYHAYNWLQFEALLPSGVGGVREHIAEIKKLIADEDWEAVTALVDELEGMVEGAESPPDVMWSETSNAKNAPGRLCASSKSLGSPVRISRAPGPRLVGASRVGGATTAAVHSRH